jgi:gluconolactonase
LPKIPIERFEIFATGLDHSECLAFDREGFLWAGGEAGQIYRIDPASKVTLIADCGGFSVGVARTPDDRELWVCNPKHGVISMTGDGKWSVVVDKEKVVAPNFGVFNRRGDYYFTDSGKWKQRSGRLLCREASGAVSLIVEPFGYANGLALTADESQLFLVESDTDSVYRVDLETGAVTLFAESVGRMPDGLALDAAGTLYASCYASDDIHRIDAGGAVEQIAWDRWAILLSRPTNMAFHQDYLYVCNLGRTTITRAKVDIAGMPLVNLRP